MISTYTKVKYALGEGGVPLLMKRTWRRMKKKVGIVHNARYRLNHAMVHGFPRAEVELRGGHTTENDVLIAERILTAFHAARACKEEAGNRDEDMWSFLEHGHHKDMLEILSEKNPHKLANYLRDVYRQSITYGITNAVEYHELASSKKLRRYEAADIKDKAVSLAELLGVLSYENPGQETLGENMKVDSDWLIHEIEKKIGVPVAPPDIDGGVFKLKMGNGYFMSRDILSLYAAWRLRQLVDPQNGSITELGPGVGKVALYASRFGFLDYSLFDLPRMNVVQAWYLIKALPEREVVLFGETAKSKNSIKILPWWEFLKVNQKKYDLTFNEDGLPEMDRGIVMDYLEAIKKNTKKYFLSINHERGDALIPGQTEKLHLIASQAVEKSGGFKRISRFPQLLRNGYVEELYEIPS